MKSVNRTHFAHNGLFILIITVFLLPGCTRVNQLLERFGLTDNSSASQTVQDVPVFAVNTTLAVEGQIQEYISLSGDIVAGSTVDAYSDAAGRVTRIYVSVGSWVSRGDRIATVDPSRPGMTFMESTVTSPISGTIAMLPAQVGMTISQAVPLARIQAAGALEIKLNVAERFISKMAMNLPCEITLDAWPGEVFLGSVRELSPNVDPASRTMEVRVNVRDTASRLKPGMFAKVRVITERKDHIVKIPASAVITRFGEQYVYVTRRDSENPAYNIVRKRVITQGILIDGIMEVQKGLEPGEEIVVRGQTLLDDGSRVNIIERVTPLGE
ncbi:MAG: efflux RND transporter periplasmic adaptor subunit [Treponema sp.]|nr:efflux RND transporter periplasmic adaptor subunit [Treponema sp.]